MPDNKQVLPVVIPSSLTVATIETLELPDNNDVAVVAIDLATAPVGSNAIFDVQVASTSLFGGLGTVRLGETAQGNDAAGLTTSSTTIVFTPSATGNAPVQGQVLTIDSEQVVATNVTGSYLTEGGLPEYTLTVTRAANGSTAATHAAGATVSATPPTVVAGATASVGVYAPAITEGPGMNAPAGSALALLCTQKGSATAGGGGTATIELVQR